MLTNTPDCPAAFPHVGSICFLRGTGEQARILRHNADGTALVSIAAAARAPVTQRASGNRVLPLEDLFAGQIEAWHAGRPARLPRKIR